MSRFDDYPYSQLKEACGTLLGRVGLIIIAVLAGSMLGGLSATRSLAGLWAGAIGMPGLSLTSILYGAGIFVLPALLIYAIVSIRCEWPLRLTLLCTVLMWWNIHKTIRWTVYDSPMAKKQQKFADSIEKGMQEALSKANQKRQTHP